VVAILTPIVASAESELQFDDIIRILSEKQFTYLGTKFIVDYTPTRRSTTLMKVTNDASAGVQKREVSQIQAGESQIILDDGQFLWHYIPSQASVVKKKRRVSFGDLSKRIRSLKDLIQQNYTVTIETHQQQPTTSSEDREPQPTPVMGDISVFFRPNKSDRPSWKIWIDSEHGLVVRSEIYDLNGDLAVLSAFSDLTFRPKLPEEALKMTVPKGTTVTTSVEQTFQSVNEAQKAVSFSISEPAYLPPGFILSSVIVSKTQQKERVQLTYIDGMSPISVFEDKHAVSAPDVAGTSKEVTINNTVKGTFYDHGLLKILNWQLSETVSITLVGEVADTELLNMAASLINSDEEHP
jgi:outer membrane lipoprotein-sorting protein